MIALRLVHLIETNADTIARSLVDRTRSSRCTANLRNVPQCELQRRTRQLLEHLGEWLLTRTDRDIEARYRELGAERAEQDIPLADTCWAVTLIKEQLFNFLQAQGIAPSPIELYGEMELQLLLDRFFDRALCHVVGGYEQHERKRSENLAKRCPEVNLAAFVP